MNSFTTFFVFAALAALALTATAGELPGTLLDSTSKEPIAGAEIRGSAPGVEASAITEADIDLIQRIIPHRYPFLLIDKVVDIVPHKGAVGIKNV